MVSCVVMSLLALLQPLNWVAPLIPVLPLKYLDFVESPVPILAGIVVEGNEIHLTPDILLAKCDDVNCNSFTAVLDTNTCEIFMVAAHRASLPGLLMPGAKILIESITEGPIAKEVLYILFLFTF